MTVRRMKTYTGGQGYVYQYYFAGKRPALASMPDGPTTEFIFDVTSDRKTVFSVSVLLPDSATRQWNASHSRQLTEAEQYGAVKMRLFQAFDDIENLQAEGRTLRIDAAGLASLLTQLGVD